MEDNRDGTTAAAKLNPSIQYLDGHTEEGDHHRNRQLECQFDQGTPGAGNDVAEN
jgi:hypothetical protein